MTTRIELSNTDWPAAEAIASHRVLNGAPEASTFVTSSLPTGETGLWRVSEGEFTTAHSGYVEHIHIIEGEGELVHENGEVIALGPGVTVTMEDGWTGRWVIRKPLVKAYAVLNTASVPAPVA